jgi:hypothetical protein
VRISVGRVLGLSNEGNPLFAFSVVLMLQTILMGAFFVSGMAVSGDWL